uniref:Uncharacterized protein n=1 Tax=Cacopsylla melanoneura TaxID=428564 RepID=A0A8D8RN05_9HEMI
MSRPSEIKYQSHFDMIPILRDLREITYRFLFPCVTCLGVCVSPFFFFRNLYRGPCTQVNVQIGPNAPPPSPITHMFSSFLLIFWTLYRNLLRTLLTIHLI